MKVSVDENPDFSSWDEGTLVVLLKEENEKMIDARMFLDVYLDNPLLAHLTYSDGEMTDQGDFFHVRLKRKSQISAKPISEDYVQDLKADSLEFGKDWKDGTRLEIITDPGEGFVDVVEFMKHHLISQERQDLFFWNQDITIKRNVYIVTLRSKSLDYLIGDASTPKKKKVRDYFLSDVSPANTVEENVAIARREADARREAENDD